MKKLEETIGSWENKISITKYPYEKSKEKRRRRSIFWAKKWENTLMLWACNNEIKIANDVSFEHPTKRGE